MNPFSALFNLVYPNLCAACGTTLIRGEQVVCTYCLSLMPYTHFHRHPDNPVARFFWGRVTLEKVASFLHFRKGTRTQKLMHKLKYRGRKDVGLLLGKLYALELKQSDWIVGIDLILPVPLHPVKERKRGYNQSAMFAEGLSITTGIPCEKNILVKTKATSTQTKKSRIARWENVSSVFAVKQPELIRDKHILLVDDIVTTGATLESCAALLLNVGASKVSVATIACTLQ